MFLACTMVCRSRFGVRSDCLGAGRTRRTCSMEGCMASTRNTMKWASLLVGRYKERSDLVLIKKRCLKKVVRELVRVQQPVLCGTILQECRRLMIRGP